MATKAQLKAISNSQLASGTEIPATKHRTVNDAIIEELFNAQSRGDVLSGVQSAGSLAGGDLVVVIRGGEAYLLDSSEFGFIDELADLTDVNIPTPANDQILAYDFSTSKWVAKDLADITTGGDISGSGTTNRLPKFSATQNITDSNISDDGTTVTVDSELNATGDTFIGDVTSPYTNFLERVLSISSTVSNTQSGIELIGNSTSDGLNSAIFFMHSNSVETFKRIAQITASRLGSDSGCDLRFAVSDTLGNIATKFNLTHNQATFDVDTQINGDLNVSGSINISGVVSKTSGTLTDGATVTVNGASKDQATFDWTANTASVSLVFSTGTAAQITSIFGKKTLAGDVTVTLDTTDYHFVDNDGADITSLTITNDSTTNKYFELSFLKSATFTESSKPVIKVLTSAI